MYFLFPKTLHGKYLILGKVPSGKKNLPINNIFFISNKCSVKSIDKYTPIVVIYTQIQVYVFMHSFTPRRTISFTTLLREATTGFISSIKQL